MIIRYTAYTSSPRQFEAYSEKRRKENPRTWALAGLGGPRSFVKDECPSRTILLEVPDSFAWSEQREYCEEVAESLGWPITEGSIDVMVSEKIIPWPKNRSVQEKPFKAGLKKT